MTPKELLYIADTLSHVQSVHESLCDFMPKLTDSNLKAEISSAQAELEKLFSDFRNLL